MAKQESIVLNEKELIDDEKNPKWGGTVVQITQYGESRPRVTLKRFYTDKTTGEVKRSGFVDIPPNAIARVVEYMTKAATWIEKMYPKPEPVSKAGAEPF